MLQLSRLLYLTVSGIDGVRDLAAVAAGVSAAYGQEVSEQNIAYLVERKLEPLGLTAAPGTDTAAPSGADRADLLSGLVGRRTLVPPRAVGAVARRLAWLHRLPFVACVLAAAVVMDCWLFFVHGAVPALQATLGRPLQLLVVFGLMVASLLFHEFGHASACREVGATPGRIGCGIYLLWPSLFTDVTDVYRVNRAGRLRTDLGGVYFNVVFMLVLAAAYAVTRQAVFPAAIYLGHFEVFEQLLPAARLDGYYLLADITGVPDVYGQVVPLVRRLRPGAWSTQGGAASGTVHEAGTSGGAPASWQLTRTARRTITAWLAAIATLLLADLVYSLWNLPRLAATAAHSVAAQAQAASEALSRGAIGSCAVAALGLALLLFPVVGLVTVLGRVAVRAVARRRAPA